MILVLQSADSVPFGVKYYVVCVLEDALKVSSTYKNVLDIIDIIMY